jgi:hypothetical protein
MKLFVKVLIEPLLLILLFSSCKKDPINPAKDISGKWEWLSTYSSNPDTTGNPLTPSNSGIHEELVFNTDHMWAKIQNNIQTESGTFTIGHGTHTPYLGAHIFIYDSVVYYQNGITKNWWVDYYKIYNDTLQFCPGFAGRFASYSLPYNGTEILIKE